MIRCFTQSIIATSLVTATLCGSSALASDGDSAVDTIVHAGRMVSPDGTIVENQRLVIGENGRIKRVEDGGGFNRSGSLSGEVHSFPDAVVVPGLIDLVSTLGVTGQNYDAAHAIDPNLDVIDAFDSSVAELQTALEYGVTSAMIIPSPSNLIAGTTAVVHTWAPNGASHVVSRHGPLLAVLGSSAWSFEREPSSRAGAMRMMRQMMADPAAYGKRIEEFVAGDRDGVILCDSPEDVFNLARLYGRGKAVPPVIYGGPVLDVVEDLASLDTTVVIGPFTAQSPAHVLAAAGALSNAGVEVAFRGGMPAGSPNRIRMTAALAARYGMDPAAARQAMTSVAAKVGGVDDKIGSLERGRHADFVIFSDDPLRLDARVLEVWIGGQRAWAAPVEWSDDDLDGFDWR